ncbi:diadenosine 5'5'''-P1,P4-tetraphosphate pyrophosphohydrolase [Cenarchaeum symbiosum A]|uniref:Bis(5'-nucleosyl)-tetraphosphatase [asymmetrical] n=1 Tax=Cenarchaeum symbiosum (strain A) TaxID=414004 RepID=A0RXM4_CENSY|nr:diadenosine 5'5'''-P1,P4-tetraphosphate pyrophosphohydrolase [Cenarchaeum symbiosum A]
MGGTGRQAAGTCTAPKRETSAGAVIFREERGSRVYLLLNYPSGHWDFVKGRMEGGESPRQTIVREAREETGIDDLEFVGGMERVIRYEFRLRGRPVQKKVIFHLARTRTSSVTISHEHRGYTWLGYGESMRKVTYENARIVLGAAERRLARRSAGRSPARGPREAGRAAAH